MKARKTPFRLILPMLLVGALGAFRYYTATGILARYGVHFDDDTTAYEHSSLNRVEFWFDTPSGRLSGPSIVGDALFVERPYKTAGGRLEFVVQSATWRDERYRIQLVSPPQGNTAFYVVDADPNNFNPIYTPERIQKTP